MANEQRMRPRKRKKVCAFCVDKVTAIDYKDTAKIRRYLSERGKILLNRVIASGSLTVRRSTGDVIFDRCDAASLSVTTDTGDVTGTLLTEKTFIPDSETGKIDVPKNTSGGICEITTDTGDIRLKIQ